jgi:hypothetical protein
MSYTPPGITVNQVIPQQTAPPSGPNVRTVAVLARFGQGPALARITPDQIQNVYGDPRSPLSGSFPGARIADMVVRQSPAGRAYSVQIIGVRAGFGITGSTITGYASISLGANTFTVYGVGTYTGSRGNRLALTVKSQNVQVLELTAGGGGLSEVQQVAFYGLGGTPTGTPGVFLTFKGVAGPPLTIAQMQSASALQTYLNALSTIGTSPTGGVTVTGGLSGTLGAYIYTVTFTGTNFAGTAQPLLLVGGTWGVTGTGVAPVQSIQVTDLVTAQAVQTINNGQYDLSTGPRIFSAINAANPPNLPSSIINATNLASSATLPAAGTYTLTGGTDGATVATSGGSLADPNATVANLLAQLATGVLGQVDFLVSEYDTATIQGQVQTFIGQAVPNNIWPKPYLGVTPGTPVNTLTSGQSAASDRIVIIGNDQLVGPNPVSPALLGMVDSPTVAAGVAGLKAATSPEFNLYNQGVSGVGNAPPVDAGTGAYLTAANLNALAGAGYTVFAYNPQLGRTVIRDLLTTAVQVDQWGNPNRFMWASERDCFDELAKALLFGLTPLIGSPAASPGQVVSQFNTRATAIMAQYQGTLHNGAVCSTNYNVTSNVVTVNVGYADRPPLNYVVINLSPMTPAAAS